MLLPSGARLSRMDGNRLLRGSKLIPEAMVRSAPLATSIENSVCWPFSGRSPYSRLPSFENA